MVEAYGEAGESDNSGVAGYLPPSLAAPWYAAADLIGNGEIDEETSSSSDLAPPDARVGWYARTNVGYDARNSSSSYDLRLEWDLFKEGYFEAQERYRRLQLQKGVQTWREEREARRRLEARLAMRRADYEHLVMADLLDLKARVYRMLREQLRKRVEAGYATVSALREMDAALADTLDERYRHTLLAHGSIPLAAWGMLNRIEKLRPMGLAALRAAADEAPAAAALEKRLAEMGERQGAWSERLRLNLYAGYRNLYVDQEQALVGVDAKVPLFTYSTNKEAEALRYRAVAAEIAWQRQKRERELEEAYAALLYHQKRIRTLQKRLAEIEQTLGEIDALARSRCGTLLPDPFRRRLEAVDRYLRTLHALYRHRFDGYEAWGRLAALSGRDPQTGKVLAR